MRIIPLALAATLCLAAGAHAHGTRGYPIAAAPSKWQLFELAISSAHAGNVRFSVEGDYRIIRSDGLPDHATGSFPNRGNPNRISAQQYEMRVPAWPQLAIRNTPLQMQSFGFAINGVPFDPGAAEFWNNDRNWQYEAMSGAVPLGLDQNNAHVQPNGAYHYHGLPTALLARFSNTKTPVLVGWAADGFPIYGPYGYSEANKPASPLVKLRSSWRLKTGARNGGPGGHYDGSFVQDYEYSTGLGNLDECNGRTGVTPEFPNGSYHYVLTETFPYIPRCFRGIPDASFARGRPGGGGPAAMKGGSGDTKGPGDRDGGKGGPPAKLCKPVAANLPAHRAVSRDAAVKRSTAAVSRHRMARSRPAGRRAGRQRNNPLCSPECAALRAGDRLARKSACACQRWTVYFALPLKSGNYFFSTPPLSTTVTALRYWKHAREGQTFNHRGATMNKLLAAVVASAFVFSSASGYAADAVKKEELTKEQRVDMRNRADKLTQERAQAPATQVKTDAAPKAKIHHAKKAKKVSRHDGTKVRPKA